MRIAKSFSFSSVTFPFLFALSLGKFNFCLLMLYLTHLFMCLFVTVCECVSVLQLYQSNRFMVECEGQCDLTTRLLTEAEVEQVLSLHRWSVWRSSAGNPPFTRLTQTQTSTNTQIDNCWLSNIRFCITYSTPFHKRAVLSRWIYSCKTSACVYSYLCVCQLVTPLTWMQQKKYGKLHYAVLVHGNTSHDIWKWDWW